MSRRALSFAIAAVALSTVELAPRAAAADDFAYLPPGDLIPGSGQGREDDVLYAPGMRFPIEAGPAFANSQVYNRGGYAGPPGGQCDAANYSYPWRDNYCETRQWEMPLCPAGTGHQGQDIRPATCEAGRHWVVAAADGTITGVGGYSVYLTDADGTRFEYLHMSDVQVSPGDTVTRGQRIGRVSNVFGDTPTTIHLHFNLRQFVSGVGTVFVPPYASLVASYRALLDPRPRGELESADCGGITGWARALAGEDMPARARLYFDSEATDPGATGYTLAADARRDDLCTALDTCEAGFQARLPLSLFGGEHVVHAYGVDAQGEADAELAGSPKAFTCALELPDGVRRPIREPASLDQWRLSRFWDVASAPDEAIEALPEGEAFPDAPRLIRADDTDASSVWLLDGSSRRLVPGPEALAAWALDAASAESWPGAKLAALTEGPVLPARPFLVQGAGPTTYVIDTRPPAADVPETGAGGAGGDAPSADATPGRLKGHVRCHAAAIGAADSSRSWLWVALAAGLGAARARRRRAHSGSNMSP